MEELSTFWAQNYDSIIISLVVGFVFFVLGPIGVWFSGRKIRRERVRKAKDALIDLLESMIVNQEEINNTKLRKMFRAIEREIDVSIDSDYDLDRLFEDVILRFQRSKHLEAIQKDAYSKNLTELSDSLKASESEGKTRILPRRYSEILKQLELSIDENNKIDTSKIIDELKDKLSISGSNGSLFQMQKRLIREHPILTGIAILAYVLFITSIESGFLNP